MRKVNFSPLKRKKRHSLSGMTLIEVVIVLLVLSMMLSAAVHGLGIYVTNGHADLAAKQIQYRLNAAKQYYLDHHVWPPEGTTVFINALIANKSFPSGIKNENILGHPFSFRWDDGTNQSPTVTLSSSWPENYKIAQYARMSLAFVEDPSHPKDPTIEAHELLPSSEISERPKLNKSTLAADPELNTMRADLLLNTKDDGSGDIAKIQVAGTNYELIPQLLSTIQDLKARIITLERLEDQQDPSNYYMDLNGESHVHRLIVDELIYDFAVGQKADISNIKGDTLEIAGDSNLGKNSFGDYIFCKGINSSEYTNNHIGSQIVKGGHIADTYLTEAQLKTGSIDASGISLENMPGPIPGSTISEAFNFINGELVDINEKIKDILDELDNGGGLF